MGSLCGLYRIKKKAFQAPKYYRTLLNENKF